ncbi:MAG: Ribose operon repressor RbsR [Frondihabitans sp.]|nr:Ribose operon repressor RbsR [Frondihabitans sp.]
MVATIREVAAAAGVSNATASRALSGHPAVLPETRERVWRAADRLSYRADPTARALRAGSSNLLALLVSNLQNPAIQQIAETVQTLGLAEGFEVVIATTSDDRERERRLMETLSGRRVDGLIAMSSGENIEFLNTLFRAGLPVVELIRLPAGTAAPAVLYDDRHAGRIATEHLLALGHQRIAFLGGPSDTRSGIERHLGFTEAVTDAGLQVDPELVARGEFSASFGVAAVEGFLSRHVAPTAMVIANHESMFAALQALNRADVRIPDDLSVVAIEDDPLLAWWHPAITAVDMRPADLAARAVQALVAQIRNEAPPSATVVAADLLLLRDSTAAPPASPVEPSGE